MGTFTTKDGKTVTLPDRKPKAAPAPATERAQTREEGGGGGGGVLLALGGLVLVLGLGAAVVVIARRRAAAPALAVVPDAPADVVVEEGT